MHQPPFLPFLLSPLFLVLLQAPQHNALLVLLVGDLGWVGGWVSGWVGGRVGRWMGLPKAREEWAVLMGWRMVLPQLSKEPGVGGWVGGWVVTHSPTYLPTYLSLC